MAMAMEKDKWLDISIENERTYHYPDGSTYTIVDPVKIRITVSSLGGHAHRVIDAKANGHYVAPGWNAVSWTVPAGAPVFTF